MDAGTTYDGNELVQRIGLATSKDLERWTKHPGNPLMAVDRRWYEDGDHAAWRETAWRDPWVFPDPEGHGFHALITARAPHGPPLTRGVVGHAWSPDLIDWEVRPPLSGRSEFGHLEVLQSEIVDGVPVLLFCCATPDMDPARRRRLPHETTGSFLARGESLLGPFDIDGSRQIPVPGLYSARIARARSGAWVVLGFTYGSERIPFAGELCDPVPLSELGLP